MGKGGLEKQARKGEKEILAGNSKTLVFYKRMISGTLILYAVVRWLQGFSTMHIVLSLISGLGLSLCYSYMQAAAKPSYSASGALVNGGTDLDMEGGMSDYFKDIIMVTCSVVMLSLLSDYFWYGWLIIPGFALYKLWSGIIAPWIFAPAAEVPGGSQGQEQDEGPKKGMRQVKKKTGTKNTGNNTGGMFSTYR